MNNPRDHKQSAQPPAVDTSLKKPLTASVIVHVVIVIIAIVGLPHIRSDEQIVEAVPIDLVADIGQLTTTNKPPVKAPPKEEPKKEEPPPKAKEPPKPPPTPEKKPEPPPQEELKEPPKKQEKTVEDLVDELAPPKKDDKKKPEPKKEEAKPKPKDDTKEKAKEQKQDFDSLLKNLTPEDPQEKAEVGDENLMTSPESSPDISNVSDILSISEMDALRQQLAGCWNIMAGAANAEDLKVEIRVEVNPDRTVKLAQVVDQGRYNSDTFYRAMAESALRAVQNPRCSPLRLPEDKYSTWRTMTIVFDPKDMF